MRLNTEFGGRSIVELSGQIEAATDITACEPLGQNLTGKVALIRSGDCHGYPGSGMSTKVLHAQEAGAAAVLIFSRDAYFREWRPQHGDAPEAAFVNISSAIISSRSSPAASSPDSVCCSPLTASLAASRGSDLVPVMMRPSVASTARSAAENVPASSSAGEARQQV